MPSPLILIGAAVASFTVWKIGMATVRSFNYDAHGQPIEPRHEVEDVESLDVYLVCAECGTEYKVSRLGELQIPRHCGEKMQVERRPARA
ncbi:MAG: hypothetical protein QOI81_771 [Actinomycetota bacterium]|nr:hypothetical protein [Actinomycetota bacterium]MEA2551379.1 hypothetical protein [Actinomycetota bacterium]